MLRLLVLTIGTALIATTAGAGVTYDFVFRPGGGGIANGSVYTPLSNDDIPIMDVLLRTTDPLVFASTSIGFDNGSGLAIRSATEWSGVAIEFDQGTPTAFFEPIAPGVTIGASSATSFDGATPEPNGPPSLSPGTYNIGTIVWDLSNLSPGANTIFAFLESGVDGTSAVLPPGSGNIVDVTGTEVLGVGFINVMPEPSTALLLGLGLAGLVVTRRRRAARAPARRL